MKPGALGMGSLESILRRMVHLGLSLWWRWENWDVPTSSVMCTPVKVETHCRDLMVLCILRCQSWRHRAGMQ